MPRQSSFCSEPMQFKSTTLLVLDDFGKEQNKLYVNLYSNGRTENETRNNKLWEFFSSLKV